jgi:hypothetical protein
MLEDSAKFDDYIIGDAIVSQIRRNMGLNSGDECVVESFIDWIIGGG